jgi:hypothetical protein
VVLYYSRKRIIDGDVVLASQVLASNRSGEKGRKKERKPAEI